MGNSTAGSVDQRSPAGRRRGQSICVAAVVFALVGVACSAPNPIDPEARPIVDRAASSTVPPRYQFSYIPISDSPFLACISGIDIVDGIIDLDQGVMVLQPRRKAPAITVTDVAIFVESTGDNEPAQQAQWTPTLDSAVLGDIFGQSISAYLADGLRTPDLNMIVLSAVSVADSVSLDSSVTEDLADTLQIAVNAEKFDDSVRAADDDDSGQNQVGETPLRLTATVERSGLVSSSVFVLFENEPEGNFALTATYDEIPPITVPELDANTVKPIRAMTYPEPQNSCEFEL